MCLIVPLKCLTTLLRALCVLFAACSPPRCFPFQMLGAVYFVIGISIIIHCSKYLKGTNLLP